MSNTACDSPYFFLLNSPVDADAGAVPGEGDEVGTEAGNGGIVDGNVETNDDGEGGESTEGSKCGRERSGVKKGENGASAPNRGERMNLPSSPSPSAAPPSCAIFWFSLLVVIRLQVEREVGGGCKESVA